MKKCINCILVFLALSLNAAGQFHQNLLQYSVLITLHVNKNINAYGTGFFFADSTNVYLVTAKHVLFKNDSLKTSICSVEYYQSQVDRSLASNMKIYLKELQLKKKIYLNKTDDIVIVEIGKITYENGHVYSNYSNEVKLIGKSSVVKGYTNYNTLTRDSVDIGSDVFLVGYPISVTGGNQFYEFNRPLLRKGVVAGKDVVKGRIVIDCFANHGNSGGPALSVKKINVFITDYKLIGIVTEIAEINGANTGYSIVEPIDKILQLIEKKGL